MICPAIRTSDFVGAFLCLPTTDCPSGIGGKSSVACAKLLVAIKEIAVTHFYAYTGLFSINKIRRVMT